MMKVEAWWVSFSFLRDNLSSLNFDINMFSFRFITIIFSSMMYVYIRNQYWLLKFLIPFYFFHIVFEYLCLHLLPLN